MRAVGPWLWVLVALAAMKVCTLAPLMAVDFGGESIRISVVKSGRTPISVVLNEASKRKSSAQVAFVDGARLLGDEASALMVKYPDRVYARARDLLGLQPGSEYVESLLKSSKLPYTIVPVPGDRASIGVKDPSGEIHSAEELVASILHYARKITEAAADGAAIVDCVITVPASWGPSQRQALIDAAKISGVNVLALVNTHAAAALQYGIERKFENTSQLVVFYDMGATTTECALAKYSSFSVKEGGSLKTYGQFEVLDVAWDATLGSEALDMLLLDHFAEEFKQLHAGLDPRDSPKATAKLKRQVKRTKEVLSANSYAPISVEELMSGHDFRSRIDRSDFEGLAESFIGRATKPLQEILLRNGLAVSDLSAVELLGGGSRVPAVKKALSEALGGRQLDMHLDADEAVVLGAGLFAANLSTTFRLRKFGMKDGITYPIMIELEPSGRGIEEASEQKGRLLLPRMKPLPVRRNVPLPNDLKADSLQAHLSFDTSEVPLPLGVSSERLATYQISGVQGAIEKHNNSAKLSLHFRADESGIVSLEKGEAFSEASEEYTVKVPVIPEGLSADLKKALENMTWPEASSQNETSKGKQNEEGGEAADPGSEEKNLTESLKPTFKEETRTRKKVVRTALKVEGPGLVFPGLTPQALKASKGKLQKLAAEERARGEASKQKNDLESYIIAFQGRLAEDEGLLAVTTEAQRDEFNDALTAAEDWLYSDGENQAANVFRSKQEELRHTGNAFELRVRESKALPKALKNAQAFFRNTRQTLGSWAVNKPWLNRTEVDDLDKQLGEAEGWLREEELKQKALHPYEDPVLLSSAIDARIEDLRKPFNRLKNKKKPKPPPAPKPSNSTANETASDSASEPVEEETLQEEDASWEDQPLAQDSEGEDSVGEAGSSKHDEL